MIKPPPHQSIPSAAMSSNPQYPDLAKVAPPGEPSAPPADDTYQWQGGPSGGANQPLNPPPYQDPPPPYTQEQDAAPLQTQQPGRTVNTTTVVITTSEFGPRPIVAFCPKCAMQVTTRVKKLAGLFSWLMCLGLCMVGCDCGCCLIPCCADACVDTEHRCPNCKTFLGAYKRC